MSFLIEWAFLISPTDFIKQKIKSGRFLLCVSGSFLRFGAIDLLTWNAITNITVCSQYLVLFSIIVLFTLSIICMIQWHWFHQASLSVIILSFIYFVLFPYESIKKTICLYHHLRVEEASHIYKIQLIDDYSSKLSFLHHGYIILLGHHGH